MHGVPGNWNYEAIQTSFDYVLTSPKLFIAEDSLIWYASKAEKMEPLRAEISKITVPDAWETIEPVGVDLNTEKIINLDYAYDNGFLCNVGTKLLDSDTSEIYYPFGGYVYNDENWINEFKYTDFYKNYTISPLQEFNVGLLKL